MSNKTIISAVIIIFSLIAFVVLFAEAYATLQSVNPIAAVAAAVVAVIGIIWFKKTSKQPT